MRTGIFVIGLIALLVGLVWIGQGTGYFPYPRSSFMINQIEWAYYGAAVAILGLMLLFYARRF
jgi:hypothetical protein